MSLLKKRLDAINNMINPDRKEEAQQQELAGKIEKARQRCGINGNERTISHCIPGASLAENIKRSREARLGGAL